jgi:hypothetical protein
MNSTSKRILSALAETIIPEGKFFPKGGEKDADKILGFFERDRKIINVLKFLLFILEKSCAFSKKTIPERERILRNWRNGTVFQKVIVELFETLIKYAHFDDEEVYLSAGCVYDKSPRSVIEPRYMSQVRSIDEFMDGEILECEAVVVGTGAGGGVVAAELAEKGIAVLMVEMGKFWTRKDFSGRPLEAVRKFYLMKGMTFAIGNAPIFIPAGSMVGGSTAINTGTCWRTPEWILKRWSEELGLKDLSPEKLAPYFERVEKIIQVEEAKDKVIGGIKEVIKRGCEVLGYKHFPLKRNAPDCDAQGVCDFGCPSGARLSVDISYVPRALKSVAALITHARAEEMVISCGAIMTPVLLLKQGIKNKQIGKNLTIHPAVTVGGYFPDVDISPHRSAPQAYCIDSLHKDGILFLGSGLPMELGAVSIPFIGERFSDIMSEYNHVGWFGVMIEDRPSGMVKLFKDRPLIFYFLRRREVELLQRGIIEMANIFLLGGAKQVFLPVRGIEDEVNSYNFELVKKRNDNVSPGQFKIVVGFHPLGTCRMGIDKNTSVVGQDFQVHGIKNLFICDGSVVPTSIAVNPQETIMALATKASEAIAERIL